MKRESNEERNRNLSIAFSISLVIWVISWSPNYVMLLVDLTEKGRFTELTLAYSLYKYVALYRVTIQMIYSQANPFLLLIIFKPFQMAMGTFFKSLLMNRVEKPENETSKTQQQSLPQKTRISKKSRGNYLFRRYFALLAVLKLCVICILVVFYLQSMEHPFLGGRRKLNRLSGEKIVLNEALEDIIQSTNVEKKCGDNHGHISVHFLRCFFFIEHSGSGANFTSHVSSCETKQVTLFYPRDEAEIDYVWRYYLFSRGWLEAPQNEPKQFLYLGYETSRDEHENVLLRSTDGKQVITRYWGGQACIWFENRLRILENEVFFTGPGNCIGSKTEEMPLEFEVNRKISVCFMDLPLFSQ